MKMKKSLLNLITKTFLFVCLISCSSILKANCQQELPAIIGRWDITMNANGKQIPSWLEVQLSGTRTLVGQFVGSGGSARPISKINFSDGKINFSIPPQWDSQNSDLIFEGTLSNDNLSGTITLPSGEKYNYTAVRAPSLNRTTEIKWSKAKALFDGKDLSGWHPSGDVNQWVVENGILRSPKPGSNLITDEKFTDFKLHVEFRCAETGNSGVYLRGRYEVQIIDSKTSEHEPYKNGLGSVYGFLQPNQEAGKAAGEWQSYDITLIGRTVTIVLNGKTIICSAIIPGITGGALDGNEGEPGPIMFQGDHEPIEYRNITITTPQ